MSTKLEALGIPGLIGFGLTVFSASMYLSAIEPMQVQLDAINNEAQKLVQTLRASPADRLPMTGSDSAMALKTGIAVTPIEIIRRLNAMAEKASVTVERVSAVITEKDDVRHVEVSFPAKGSYVGIRRYLRQAVSISNNGRIEKLLLQRARATDSLLDADVKLSFELEKE